METLDGNYSNIRKKIDRLENVLGLDLDKLMSGETNSAENMQSYYNVTDFAFKKFHSKYGFMHFHVSQNGKFSPEDAFYQPDTVARIRTDYVHEQQSRYRTAIADLEQRINGASTSERVKLNKQLSILQAQATEIRSYEEKIHHLADQMIKIDLDDGVKRNYEIFKDVLAKIK